MTMIIEGYASKKALREAVAAGTEVTVYDPSLMEDWRKYGEYFKISSLPEGASIVATNHPKRSWFAEISVKGGKIKVS